MPLGELANWLFGGEDGEPSPPTGPRLEAAGKPTIQLPPDPEAEIRRVEKLTRDPSARTSFVGFISAVYELVCRQDTSPENLARLTAGLDCNYKLLRDGIGEQLMHLSHHFPEVSHEFMRVMNEAPPARRLELIKAIWRATPPRPTTVALLTKALTDTEERVRYFAVDRIRTGELRELLPQLKELRQHESDDKLRRFIDFNVGLLETGFYVEDKPDTHERVVTVYLGKGGTSSKSIPAADYSPRRVQQVLEKLRADWNRLQGRQAR